MNFEINTNINSINEYNKTFDASLKHIGAHLDDAGKFNSVFNSVGENVAKNTKEPNKLRGSVSMFISDDVINAQKVENLSESAKMARDIGEGFSNGLNNLSSTQKEAEDAMETFAAGGDISVHDVMISAQKSSLAMQMAIQLRNKMISAYNEFKDMRF